MAVQAQDYAGASWGLGQRLPGWTEADIGRAFDGGVFVRTHLLRPTWHFVAPDDLRWLLALTGPRVLRAIAHGERWLGIDAELVARAARVFEREISREGPQTREALGRALAAAGIQATGGRLAFLVTHAELVGLLCSGPRHGRAQTYALLDERVPAAPPRSRDEALAELAGRYVVGHGPAQDVDFAWWSGLSLTDARRGLAAAAPPLVGEVLDGRTFWSSPTAWSTARIPPTVHLLPNYDELLVAFRDRTDALHPALPAPALVASEILSHVIVGDGRVVGRWRRSARPEGHTVTVELGAPLDSTARERLRAAADRYAAFLGRFVELTGLD